MKRRGSLDLPFTMLTMLLLTIGVVMVLSASYASAYYTQDGVATYFFVHQLGFAVAGTVLMIVCSLLPINFYRRLAWPLLIASVALLVLVLFAGTVANGARRWIKIGPISFQPSELAKLAVVLVFASIICKQREGINRLFKGLLPSLAILVVICYLLHKEPHTSAMIIIFALGLSMLYIGGLKYRWLLLGAVAAAAGFAVIVMLKPYALDRVRIWLDPFSDLQGDGWQIVQSLYAIGSGGVLGLGLGNSRQKYLYLPEEHNDYIFSIICEELGFIGAILILILFALLIVRGYWLAMHARSRYSRLVATGITTSLALQVILNVAVCTNTIPSTGISLPFFSYGGTALLLQMVEVGIMLSISRDIPDKK